MNRMTTPAIACRRLQDAPWHHFFGYYNKTVWHRDGRYLLANRTPVKDAVLTPELRAEVGYFDLQDGDRYHAAGATTAWNWQMGCQLQWLDGKAEPQLIYNCRRDDDGGFYPGFRSAVYNLVTGQTRYLPLPIYVAAPDSRYALCVDYRRLYITHQTIGYSEHAPAPVANAPADDGIHTLDLDSGAHRLLVSYADLRDFHPRASMERAIHWVSHIEVNPSSTRILFLHRWT